MATTSGAYLFSPVPMSLFKGFLFSKRGECPSKIPLSRLEMSMDEVVKQLPTIPNQLRIRMRDAALPCLESRRPLAVLLNVLSMNQNS